MNDDTGSATAATVVPDPSDEPRTVPEIVSIALSSPDQFLRRTFSIRRHCPELWNLRWAVCALASLYVYTMGWPSTGGLVSGFEVLIWWALHFWGLGLLVTIAILADYGCRELIAEIKVNSAIAEVVGERADEDVKRTARPQLDRLKSYVDEYQNNKSCAAYRLLIRIVNDARGWRFDTLRNLVTPYQREAYAQKARIEGLQRLSLRLGILGAFIGLLTVLGKMAPEVAHLLNAGKEDSVEITSLFRALFLKFGPSIGGLIGGLYAFGTSRIVDEQLQSYFRTMEASAQSMLDASSRAFNDNDFAHHFTQIREQIKSVDLAVNAQNDRVESLLEQCEAVGKVPGEMATTFETMRDSQSKFIEDFRRLHRLASLDQMMTSFQKGLERITMANQNALSKQVQDAQAAAAQTLSDLHRDVRVLVGPMKQYLLSLFLVVLLVGAILGYLITTRLGR